MANKKTNESQGKESQSKTEKVVPGRHKASGGKKKQDK